MIETVFKHNNDSKTPEQPLRNLADDIRELGSLARQKGFVPVNGKYLGPVATTTVAPRTNETEWPREAKVIISAIDHPSSNEKERVSATLVDPASRDKTRNVIAGSLGNMVLYNESGEIKAGVSIYDQKTNVMGTFDQLLGEKAGGLVKNEGVDHLIDQAAEAPDFAVLQPTGEIKTYPIDQLYPPIPPAAA
jgi:hypothetical protein